MPAFRLDVVLLALFAAALVLLAGSCHDSATAGEGAQPKAISSSTAPAPETIPLPSGEGGIGLDDLRYSPALRKVLAPAGRTGNLDLVDPSTGAVTIISGFGATGSYAGGHGDGTTSVDEGAGYLFAIDRTSKKVDVVDPVKRSIVSAAALAADPDYVRYVSAANELWVTEPDAEQIEVFRLTSGTPPVPEHAAVIAVPGGPESLVIDTKRGRGYTHLWEGTTLAIDVHLRSIVGRWANGCSGSRGIALDEGRGFLFVGCAEGRAVVLDVDHDGKELSRAATGEGVDIIDYDARRAHLYFPAAKSATLTILGVSAHGELSVLGTFPAAKGSHCATTDDDGHVFVGDPKAGRLLRVLDPFPASAR
jgi:hypothetical protein